MPRTPVEAIVEDVAIPGPVPLSRFGQDCRGIPGRLYPERPRYLSRPNGLVLEPHRRGLATRQKQTRNMNMTRRIFCIVALLVFSGQAYTQAQTVSYGSASFMMGGNSWTGIAVPDGLWGAATKFPSSSFQIYASMKQENSITPGWVDVWDYTEELPIDNGMSMSWQVDLPSPGGWIHCEYNGMLKISTYWGYFQSYIVNYKVTSTYHSY